MHIAHRTLPFKVAKEAGKNELAMKLVRSHIFHGEPLSLNIASQISGTQHAYEVGIKNAQDEVVLIKNYIVVRDAIVSNNTLILPTEEFPTGEYQIALKDKKQTYQTLPFSILPEIDIEQMERSIASYDRGRLSTGTINTLRFKLLSLNAELESLEYYETAESVAKQFNALNQETLLAKGRKDPYISLGRHTPYRRAFKSSVDNSYQPYSIKLPVDYNPEEKYPLLVFLHGSGTDEQNLLKKERGNGQFIELAPFARDKYRAYSSVLSQKDITDAINDVMSHFSVDSQNIVIGGFSMGGYGALRTFYENPTLYRGVAVFAGHPNLANEWLDGDYPNFLESPYLDKLNDKPVFIYHGTSDPAVPFDLMKQLANKVKQNGGEVTTSFVPQRGHVYQDKATHELYNNWLLAIIRKDNGQ